MPTFAEYLAYQAPPNRRDELIHGEIVLSPSPSRRHQDLCHQIQKLLEAAVSLDYVVRLDTTMKLGIREGPRPDVFVIDRKRWVASDEHSGFPEGSPQLVVEVKSESNSWPELLEKKDLYLSDAHCLAVWIIDPDPRMVHLYDRVGCRIFDSQTSISVPEALGKGNIGVEDIFSGIV
ncbi:MAG: Uma2 family endonuclease [Bryobacteraceae bacterium]